MRSPAFYKFLSAVLAVLLALGGAYAAKMIHDAQTDVNTFRHEHDELQSQLNLRNLELQKSHEFIQKLNDPAFLEYLSRHHLDYAKPEEYIFRFDVDPLTGASPEVQDKSKPLQIAPAPSTTHAPAPRGTTPTRRNP